MVLPGEGGPTRDAPELGGARREPKSAIRRTEHHWTYVALKAPKVVTGIAGERPLTKQRHLEQVLGCEAARASGDRRPVLLYFHWPHADPVHGKRTTDTCTRVLEEEQVARWALFFRPVRIEMEQSDADLAGTLGVGKGPSFVVLAPDLSIRARFEAPRSSAKLVKALRDALHQRPEFAKRLAGDIAAQKKQLEAAKALEKEGRLKHALWLAKRIQSSQIRVAPVWDQADGYVRQLEAKIRNAKEEAPEAG